jgi:hypothetical protein
VYPAEILALFPPFPRTNRVFVAMSFDRTFDDVWENVFSPAVADTVWQGAPLLAHRVNLTRKSDSVITEVVQEIAQSRLVMVDISTMGWLHGGAPHQRPVRNANVMYELGIAHAARLSEEVIIVRGDSDPLDFDIAGVRVHQYPTDKSAARNLIQSLLTDALASVDQRRHVAVKRALRTMNPQMYLYLQHFGDMRPPATRTMGQMLQAIEEQEAMRHLLSEGMMEAKFGPLPDNFMERPVTELVRYEKTPFGAAVFAAARQEMGFYEAIKNWIATDAGKAWLAEHGSAPVEKLASHGEGPQG